jgi:hypothetical protein
MKKLFTSLIALAAVASAGAFTSQEVSDLSQIVDGGTYVFLNQHPDGNRVMTLSDDGSTITFATYSDETTAVANTKCHWLLTKTEDYTCAHTGYTSDNHKGIFFISQDGNYWKHATSASISTVTTPGDIATYFEFIKLTTYGGGSLSSDSQYFSILGNWQSSISTLMSCLVLDASGSANQYSARTDASVTYTASNYYTTYSQYFKIYRIVYTTAEKLAQLKTTYKAQLPDASVYGITDNTDYSAQIDAVTATSESQLTTAETTMQNIVAAAQQVITSKYVGKYYTFQASGNSCYLKNDGTNVSNSIELDPYAVWKVESATVTGSQLDVVLYSPSHQRYLGSLTSWSSNTVMPVVTSLEDAVPYSVIPIVSGNDSKVALATTKFSSTTNCIHINNDVTSIAGKACYWSYSGSDNSQWNVSEVDIDQVRDMLQGIGDAFDTTLNHYSCSDAATQSIAALKEAANDDSKTIDELCKAYNDNYSTIYSSETTLNMPQSGRYLRIYTAPAWCAANAWTTAPYLTCTNTVVDSNPYATFATAKDATSIMYFTGEGLIAYTNGRYAKSSSGKSMIYFTSDDEDASANTGATLSFIEGDGEAGTYSVKYSGTRYMYTGTGLYTNGGSSNSGGGYNFQLEYVDELPLTIGSDGAASFCAPVAVTIPSGTDCKFFTASLSGTDLTITPVNAGTECAAHTPIFVQGAADTTVNFAINYDATEAESDENTVATFYANTAWSSFSEQEGYLTYMPTTATATETETETDSSASAAPAIRRVASETNDATVAFAKLAAGGDITANVPILNVATSSIGNSEAVETFTIDLSVTEPDTFSLVSVVTSINEVNADAAAAQPIYDLQGRRVTSTPTHGIFIFGNKIRRI